MDLNAFKNSLLQNVRNIGQGFINNVGNEVQHLPQQIGGLIQNMSRPIVNQNIGNSTPINYGHVAQQAATNVGNYFNPNMVGSAGNPRANFWTTPVAQGLSNIQQFNANAPRLNVSQDWTKNIQNPVEHFIAQTALSIPESILNAPSDILRSGNQLGTDIRTGQFAQPGTAIRDVASAALPLITIGTLGGGTLVKQGAEGAFKQAGEQGVKEALLTGAKTGAKIGGGFGVLQGLASSNQLPQQLLAAAKYGTVNALLGGGIGAVTEGGGNIAGKIFDNVSQAIKRVRPDLTDQQVKIESGKYLRDRAGRFAGLTPIEKAGGGFLSNKKDMVVNDWKDKVDQALGLDQLNPQAGFVKIGPDKAFNINKENLNIGKQAKADLTSTVEAIKPQLEQVRGKTLTNQEIQKAAQTSKLLTNAVSRDQTLKTTAAIEKLRQSVAAGAQGEGVSKDFINNLRVLSSYAADTGRKLQSFNIKADPALGTVKQEVVQKLLDLGHSTDEILKAAKGVDFNNQQAVTKFYRQFVKPTLPELLNEYRYNNLLSSPQTHIVNAASNAIQVGLLSPATKLVSGAIDTFGSRLRGADQQHYISEVPAYYRGAFNSVGSAVTNFVDALQGKTFVQRPDINNLPTGSKILAPMQYISRALEAGDVFFRTIAQSAEKEALIAKSLKQGKTIDKALLDSQAADKAAYYIFRKPIDTSNSTGQGHVLSAIDSFTNGIYSLRRLPYVGKAIGWFIPFVQTPMNILKQGLEYSPAGVSTLYGANNKTEQLAKAIIGSGVMAGTAWLAQVGDSTWAAPTSAKQKEEFYSTGRMPYSLKIGNQWVSYSRLGPLAYPMAMAAAVKYYTQQDPKALTEDKLQQVAKVVGGMAKFFSDQSYVSGLGNLVKAIQGDPYYSIQTISSVPSQLIPLSSLTGWVARNLDPIYRNPKGVVQSLEASIPFASQNVPAYTNPLGQPSQRINQLFNSLSPVKVQPTQNPLFEQMYQGSQTKSANTAQANQIKQQLLNGQQTSGQAGNTLYFLDKTNSLQQIDMSPYSKIPTTAVAKAKLDNQRFTDADKVLNSSLSDSEKQAAYQQMGADPQDVAYYDNAKQREDIKSVFVREQLSNFQGDHQALLDQLAQWRKDVAGQQLLTSGVISDLVSEGDITSAEGSMLNKISYKKDLQGNYQLKLTGRIGSKAKLALAPTGGKFQLKNYSSPNIRLAPPTQIRVPNVNFSTPFSAGAIPQAPNFKTKIKFNL